MTILYDPTSMNQLYSELQTHGGKMRGEIDALHTEANNFHANLTGTNATEGFATAHRNVTNELDDTLVKLDQLAAEVENALNRALEADGKVGDGFAGF